MTKFGSELKLQIAKRYLQGFISYRDLASETGVDDSSIRYWVKLVRHHGDQAFVFPYTNYSPAFKLELIQFIERTGCSIREASAIYHIPDSSMARRWKEKWKKGGYDALRMYEKGSKAVSEKKNNTDESIESVKRENEQLRAENAYLKKLNGLSSREGKIGTKEKAQVIQELRHAFRLQVLIKVAGLAHSTFYYASKKLSQPDPDRKWKRRVLFIYNTHNGRVGYRRITDILVRKNYKVNHKKVYRIMVALGIACQVNQKKYVSYKGKVGKTADNVLDRHFKSDRPNQKWVTDITEFRVFSQKFYLSPVLDLFNGEIISYTLGERPTFSLVEEMLDQALEKKEEHEDLLIHSDQGWHYQMAQFRKKLQDHNITQSMSRKGNCHDNSVMENFFGIFKSEFLYYEEFDSIQHFKDRFETYMHYYNHLRVKSRLKGNSPVLERQMYEKAS
ncbi:IS3 family transposase [Halobacillus litoralis]|uniref:IS3 family transposase n=1 Tax=Halobacillus litoralis TaxID=45668 RepID=A0A410MGP1_9BACI|nr:IS3 family transposase [Halobacillus litoralis]QAS53853.1 IS3 family transposase [Halobacillus litoralis]